jgi:hypothetical protein
MVRRREASVCASSGHLFAFLAATGLGGKLSILD